MIATTTRIRRLYIEQLFGEGSHDIDIHFGLEQRVTALYGRNGSGKTITLALLAAVCEGRYHELFDVPMKRLRLECTDGSALELRPKSGEQATDGASAILDGRLAVRKWEYRLERAGTPVDDGAWSSVDSWHPLKLGPAEERLKAELQYIEQTVMRQEIMQRVNPEDLLRLDVLEARLAEVTARRVHQDLEQFRQRLPRPKLIRADRLRTPPRRDEEAAETPEHRRPSGSTLMVEHLSDQIRTLVVAANEAYHRLSTRLDGSLPQRLFTVGAPVPDLEALRSRVQALADQERRLYALGLIGENPPLQEVDRLSEAQRGTFAVILGDREEKLKPFASVVSRSERLLQSLNRKLAPKVVRLDVKSGYQVYGAVGKLIPLSRLSSGEQHELVLLHELLFEVQPGGLILIDEPELSLHVSWQEDVMKELTDIARLAELDIVVATHSPYIVGEGDPQMVRLGPAA